MTGEDFTTFVGRATGHTPYPYQERLARDGFPELLKVPTGCGKTLAAVLPWLYRRRFHPDEAVRASTPRWLVFTLPMRTLVEQTHNVVAGWLDRLGLAAEVRLNKVMGGESRADAAWRAAPDRDAIFVGTLDMLVSRALNRGYGESRFVWPIDFGLFNNGCQWVFDEIQLMGAALPTSRQLEGLRRAIGTAAPTASMWMSATVDEAAVRTVDLPGIASVGELDDADRSGGLRVRLEARKRVAEVATSSAAAYEDDLAHVLLAAHRPGTLTIAVVNVVERARTLYTTLRRQVGDGGPDIVLLHSRFRPADRAERAAAALAPVDGEGAGRIVVATQVIEAGVDISAAVLLTEAAPWPSIVQRAGRCNRDGAVEGARLLWAEPPKPAPYEPADVAGSVTALRDLEGHAVTPTTLGALAVPTRPVVHPVLRRRDLVGLFDTTPDLSGNDLDVARYIRAVDDIDVHVAWRTETPGLAADAPTGDELCPVPVGEARRFIKAGGRQAWQFDHLAGGWQKTEPAAMRPGQILVLRASDGGYEPATGWYPASKRPVPVATREEPSALAMADAAVDGDPVSFVAGRWVGLAEHLADVEREAASLAQCFAAVGLERPHLEAAAVAGRLHDIGKAHEEFQCTLLRSCGDDGERAQRAAGVPWAKSGGPGSARHARRYLRHELASLLMLLGDGRAVLDGLAEPDLVRYLVAAHHGRVRLAIRPLPGEEHPDGGRVALGIRDGDALPAVAIPGGEVPACTLDLSPMELGDGPDGEPSWTARALALRDRPDLGPFRLAFLEAVVRLADWRASASYEQAARS